MKRPLHHERLIMQALPHELTSLILVFAPLFSKGVWSAVQVLLAGAILAVGPRTISAVLRVMGLSEEEQFQKYHRVLNRAKWSPIAASRKLMLILIDAFVPEGPLVMILDDTIERRHGAKIAARGIYRDPVRSSRSHFVKASGLRWLCLMLLAPHSVRCWRDRGSREDSPCDTQFEDDSFGQSGWHRHNQRGCCGMRADKERQRTARIGSSCRPSALCSQIRRA
jgi:hypothetical protein